MGEPTLTVGESQTLYWSDWSGISRKPRVPKTIKYSKHPTGRWPSRRVTTHIYDV